MSSVGAAPPDRSAQRPAMDAADAARREDADPGRRGGDHRGRHRRRRPAALGQRHREARPGGLADRAGRGRRERLERRRIQPDEEPPVVDRDGRRDGAIGLADGGLGCRGDLEVLRVRQAVADERRFERDDRPALGQRGGDLGRDDQAAGERRATSGETGMSQAYRRRYPVAHAASSPDDPRRPPTRGRRRGARPLGRRPDGDRRPAHRSRATATSATCSRSTLARPRADPPAAPADQGTIRDTQAAPLPGWPYPRLRPLGSRPTTTAVAAIALLDLRPGGRRAAAEGGPARRGRARSPGRRTAAASHSPPRSIRRGSSSARSRRSAVDRARAQGRHGASPPRAPRRITRTDWRWDEEGHLDRWSHLFVLDLAGGRPRQVTQRRLGRRATSPGTRTAGPSPSPRDRGREPDLPSADDDLGGRRRRGRRTRTQPNRARSSRRRRLGEPPGLVAGRTLVAAFGVLEPEPLDDLSPGVIVGPADGARPAGGAGPGPRPPDRQLGRLRT